MSLSVYQSLRFVYLSTYVRYKGKYHQIIFKGGTTAPRKINGTFSTTDEELQRSIESSPEFGKEFTRIMPPMEKMMEPVKPAEPAPTAPAGNISPEKVTESPTLPQDGPAPDASSEAPGQEKSDPADDVPVSITGIVNAQQAKNYIMTNFPGKFTGGQIMSKSAIFKAAKSLNVNFPDWNYTE